jgi:hypothetical protein
VVLVVGKAGPLGGRVEVYIYVVGRGTHVPDRAVSLTGRAVLVEDRPAFCLA